MREREGGGFWPSRILHQDKWERERVKFLKNPNTFQDKSDLDLHKIRK